MTEKEEIASMRGVQFAVFPELRDAVDLWLAADWRGASNFLGALFWRPCQKDGTGSRESGTRQTLLSELHPDRLQIFVPGEIGWH